jgi:hypothetical protein
VILTGYGLFKEKYWFWIGVGALFGYATVLNILFTLFLTLLNRKFILSFEGQNNVSFFVIILTQNDFSFTAIGTLQAVVSKDKIRHRDSRKKNDRVALELRSYLHSNSLNGNTRKLNIFRYCSHRKNKISIHKAFDCVPLTGLNLKKRKGMVLPFQPLNMCFRNINYYVDVPEVRQSWIIYRSLLRIK